MKLGDLKWALGVAVASALHGNHTGCDCHPRLSYRGPERRKAPDDSADPACAQTHAARPSGKAHDLSVS